MPAQEDDGTTAAGAAIDRLLAAGIPATFTGSGGAVVGVMPGAGPDVVRDAVEGLDVEIRAIDAAPAHPDGVPVVDEV